MAGVASSSRPTTARASMASGRRTFPVTGGKSYHFRANYQARGSPCRGGASWPRSTGRRAGPAGAPGSAAGQRVISAGPRRWPRPSSPRRGRPTAAAGPRSRIRIRPRRGRRRRSSSCICAGRPDGEVRWSGVSLAETGPPPPRTVRLATVHFRPSGGRTPGGQLPHVRAADRRGGAAEGRPGRARRDAHLRRPGQVVSRRGRTDPRPVHRVLRPAGAAAQHVHRARPARARRPSGLQRRRADRSRRPG